MQGRDRDCRGEKHRLHTGAFLTGPGLVPLLYHRTPDFSVLRQPTSARLPETIAFECRVVVAPNGGKLHQNAQGDGMGCRDNRIDA